IKLFCNSHYHCEFQFIEDVWSVINGKVVHSSSHLNLLFIRNTLLNAFKKKITLKVIVRL
ncbi:hypothetical protein C1646_716626, partial [Rhizophagus diaphanus]